VSQIYFQEFSQFLADDVCIFDTKIVKREIMHLDLERCGVKVLLVGQKVTGPMFQNKVVAINVPWTCV
jgi:hypothetical protein